MKTLKQIAASLSLYQFQDIPAAWQSKDNRKDGVCEVPEFLKTLPGYEVGNFFECKIENEGTPREVHFIEYQTHILIKKNGSDLLIRLNEDTYRKKYTFMPNWNYLKKYYKISSDKRQEAVKELHEPNQIGVFSVSKVEAWVKYCEDYIKVMDNLFEQVNEKNAEIEEKIKKFIDSLPGCHVGNYQNITDVETNLFRVRFEHFKDRHYLNTKIDFKGGLQDITTLYNMSVLKEC